MSLAGLHVFLPGYDPAHDTSRMSKIERLEYLADRALWDAMKDSDREFLRRLGVLDRGFVEHAEPTVEPVRRLCGTNSTGPR